MIPDKTRPARASKVCTCKARNFQLHRYYVSVRSEILQARYTKQEIFI